MKKPERKIAVYSRKSKFTGKGESVENQIQLCRQYIAAHFPQFGPEGIIIYEDEGYSGGNTQRPQFRRMMADARAGRLMAVVCYRLDRISRNIGDFARLIEELERLGVALVSIREQFDTSSPMGRAMMYISSVFSQLERETIAERIRDNMYELSKTGRWLGGVTPTGYASEEVKSAETDGKLRKFHRLKIIPEEAEMIKTIFSKFIETGSLTRTEAFLLNHGYETKNKKPFSRFSIRNILSNPVYMMADETALQYISQNQIEIFSRPEDFDSRRGLMVYNRTLQKPGKAHQLRPKSEWVFAVGRHEGFISGRLWVKAQEKLEQNRSKSYGRPRSNTALLPGLLRCGGCGGHMRPKLLQRKNEKGERRYIYLCAVKEKSQSGLCQMKNCDGNQADQAVVSAILDLEPNRAELIRSLEQGRERIGKQDTGPGSGIRRLRGAMEENDRAIDHLLRMGPESDSAGARERILERINQLSKENESFEKRIKELQGRELSESRLTEKEMEGVLAGLLAFDGVFEKMGLEWRREAARGMVEALHWDGKGLEIILGPGGKDADPLCEYSK